MFTNQYNLFGVSLSVSFRKPRTNLNNVCLKAVLVRINAVLVRINAVLVRINAVLVRINAVLVRINAVLVCFLVMHPLHSV